MQLITFISTASAMVAVATADRSAVTLNEECNLSQPHARVHNRCDYDVYLWSVYQGNGCPTSEMVTLKKGETYSENYAEPLDGKTGVSIKISKEQQCKGSDIVQLEYFLNNKDAAFAMNYLDVSYVDCTGDKCPTRQEGYYLQAGNQTGAATASAGNTWCPILSCDDVASCSKVSYVLPDDVQTKTCDLQSNMDFYMCGGEAPGSEDDSTPASSSEEVSSPTPSPTSSAEESSTQEYNVKAAAVTNAPEIKAAQGQKTKTQYEVVYATVYEYVNAKRHAHGHARRHQAFHA